jgi:predicted ATPase
MRLTELHIAGYCSIRDARRLRLDQLNIIIGPNGCGKTNLYRSLELLHAAAGGGLAELISSQTYVNTLQLEKLKGETRVLGYGAPGRVEE